LRALNLLAIPFVLAIPVLLIATNIRWLAGEEGFYRLEFSRYDAQARTGLPQGELRRVARELIDYFNSDAPALDIQIVQGGQQVPLFNPRERAHLADVKGLLQGTFRAQEGALILVLLYPTLAFLLRRRALRPLARQALWGAGLTLALVLILGALALLNFDWAFLQFHFLAFANELWRLDPSTDRLIQMFPQGFFYDATLLVGLLTAVEGGGLAAIAGLYLYLTRRRAPQEAETLARV